MTEDQELLAGIAITTFRLNGQVLDLAEELARPVGLTAAWWQVLGAVLPGPLTVSAIAREMGITRQSVQRIADLLVDRGLAAYADNPAHQRARLVVGTEAGRAAVTRIGPAHAEAAARLSAEVGVSRLRDALGMLGELSAALDAMAAPASSGLSHAP